MRVVPIQEAPGRAGRADRGWRSSLLRPESCGAIDVGAAWPRTMDLWFWFDTGATSPGSTVPVGR